MRYLFFSIVVFAACHDKTSDSQLKSKLNEAILLKDADSIAYFQFKKDNAAQLKELDSLSKTHQITREQQAIHDSLIQMGINLAMKFVKDKMKINDLNKN